MRLRCHLLGCWEIDEAPVCGRCGAWRYDGMIDRGRLAVVFDWWHRLRAWTWPRCWHCDRLLVFRRKVDERFCSAECREQWIPF